MVGVRAKQLARLSLVAGFALSAAGCDFFELFTLTPFPTFLEGVEYVLELPDLDEYNAIAGRSESGTRYDLAVIGTGPTMRVLLKVEPPSSVGGGFEYRGRIIVFDEDLNPQGVIAPETPLDYLSRPYAYTHNAGDLLIGYSVIGAAPLFPLVQALDPHGLTGFAVAQIGPPAETHLFSTPSGAFSGFKLEIRSYSGLPGYWAAPVVATVDVIPQADWPAPDDPDFTRLGFQLLGVDYYEPSDEITFLLSRPSEQYVVAVKAILADVLSGTTPNLLASAAATGDLRLDGLDRPGASLDDQGFFLLQRDGWFVQYDWAAATRATVGPQEGPRVVGDTSFTRRYAFYPLGDTFYRFDPAALTLTKIKAWE